MDALITRLRDDDIYIEHLIDLIPVHCYFEHNVRQKIIKAKHRATNKKVKASKRNKLSKKGKHTLARLDPSQQKSISQIQHELNKKEKKSQKKKIKPLSSATSRATNLQELQEKLKSRITAVSGKGEKSDVSSEKKTPKRKREKPKNKEAAKKIKINSHNKELNKTLSKKETEPPTKPAFNAENKIVYSKFEFPEAETKAAKSKYVSKKPEKLLSNLKKEKEKHKAMEVNSPEKTLAIKEKATWMKAIDRAKGIKVKDNPELLKQTIKKQKQRKRQSQKKWEERKNVTKKLQERRQQKRKTNIRAKKQEKIDKKIKRAKKKGRILESV